MNGTRSNLQTSFTKLSTTEVEFLFLLYSHVFYINGYIAFECTHLPLVIQKAHVMIENAAVMSLKVPSAPV